MKWKTIIEKSNKVLMIENSEKRIDSTGNKIINLLFVYTTNKNFDIGLKNDILEIFDTLWLDYDLDRIWKRNHDKTIDVIRENKELLKNSNLKLIVIHSWNPWGRKLLQKELKDLDVEIILKRHWKII